jgi:hypothetical protein
MPIFLALLVGGGVGAGGFFYGRDQHKKRVAEHAAFRQCLAELEELKDRLGTKNEQVRTLASIIQRMKREQGLAA